MEEQLKLWLVPPLIMGLVLYFFPARQPLAWSWGYLLQATLMILASLLGFFVGPDWFWLIAAWSTFFCFLVLPKLLIKRCERAIGLLQAKTLSETALYSPICIGESWADLQRTCILRHR